MPNLPRTVSVVIPVHNGGEKFRHCLEGLKSLSPSPLEIIVIADGDVDGSAQRAREFGAKVIEVTDRGGPARARNIGANAARGDIIFFLDGDVVVPSDTIAQIEAEFAAHDDLAAFIGSYDESPGASNFLSQYKNLFNHYVHQNANEEASTFWGACGAIRQEVFLAVGGFDESYRRPCIEDIELGYRLKEAGYQLRVRKTLQVKHLKCWRPLSLLKADIFDRALPWTELLMERGKIDNDLNLNRVSRLSVILVYLGVMAAIAAWFWLPLLGLVVLSALALLVLNAQVYRFFWRQRGLWFSLRVIPWHWFYFGYGGMAFVLGTIRYQYKRLLSGVTMTVSATR